MEEKIYVDGTIFLADSLAFLPIDRVLEVPNRGPRICKMTMEAFKGLGKFKNKEIHQISLQRWDFGTLSLIFVVEKFTQLDWDKLRLVFIESVEMSINSMTGSKSRQHWKTVLMNNTYNKIFERGYGDTSRLQLAVFGEDIKQFSCFLIENVQNTFGEKFTGVVAEIKFCLTILGQNATYDAAMKALKLYNIKFVDTFIIHLARDFSQTNKCLLWDLEKTKKHSSTHQAEFYYPGLTIGAGNVYYTLKDIGEDGDNSNFVRAKIIKYYSSLCKEVHRAHPMPFKHGVFHNGILQDGNGTNKKHFDETLRAIESVRTNINNAIAAGKNTARLEVIFVIDKPSINSLENVFTEFESEFGNEMKARLVTKDFDELVTHFRQTIYPVLNTLQDIVDGFLKGRAKNRHYMMTFGEMSLGAACELIAAYFVYGSIRNDREYQNRDLAAYLSLRKKIYTSCVESGIFPGLSFTESVIVKHGRVTLDQPLQFQAGYVKEILKLLSEGDAREIWRIVMASNSEFEQLSRLVWKALIKYSESKVFPNFESNQTYNNRNLVMSKIREREMHPMSCIEFMDYVFENSCLLQGKCLVQLLRSIQGSVAVQSLIAFKTQSSHYIERELYAWNSFVFLHPVNNDKLFGVLPLYRYDEISFELLENDSKLNLLGVYEMVYKQYLGLTTRKIEAYIKEVQVSNRRNIRLVDMFHSIWQQELAEEICERLNIPSSHSSRPLLRRFN